MTPPQAMAPAATFNMPEMGSALDASVERVAADQPAGQRAEIRQKAEQLLSTMSPQDAADLKELQKLTVTLGLPATRTLFGHMVTASGISGKKKVDAIKRIEAFSPITEVGCMRVDFHNRVTSLPDVAYLLLEEVPSTFNFGTDVDKLMPLIVAPGTKPEDDPKWKEVTKSLSNVLNTGRAVYGHFARKNIDLIQEIFGFPANDPCTFFLDLVIDRASTTLLLRPEWPARIGLRIRLESEVRKLMAKDAKKAIARAAAGPAGGGGAA